MSSLIVEVCLVDDVVDHPNADRMKVAKVKGWTVCIRHDPATSMSQFRPGDRCVYFPPDTVIPHRLSDRLGITKYLGSLPADDEGNRPAAGRIRVTRLRGFPSYGLIMECDKNWDVGTNVAEFYNATKYEPPAQPNMGDSERGNPAFHKYHDMENIRNFPDLFAPGDDVVVTEKIHGMNCRLGLIKENDETTGDLVWRWAAGSHDVRRKQFFHQQRRFDAYKLVESMVLTSPNVELEQIIDDQAGRLWKVIELVDSDADDGRRLFRAELVDREQKPIEVQSDFWAYFTPQIKRMMMELSMCGYTDDPDGKPVLDGDSHNVMVFGERYGSGVQKGYSYGHQQGQSAFRAFDVTVDMQYLGHDQKWAAFEKFGISHVPILFEGGFDFPMIERLAQGPSTLGESTGAKDDSQKVGREGVVITSRVESSAQTGRKLHLRRQLKCINFDYLARKGGTEYH